LKITGAIDLLTTSIFGLCCIHRTLLGLRCLN
jgi:hypothetical protein